MSYLIAKNLVGDIKYVSLVNLTSDKEVVKELLQNDFNPVNLDKELNLLFDKNKRNFILQDYQKLKTKISKDRYASDVVAEKILR